MPTNYPRTAQTGEQGVALVRKITTDAGAVYRAFDSTDLGVDGTIELLTDDREPSGDLLLVQVKSGQSYIRRGVFYLDTDRAHFETWARYALPVIGIVCDPQGGTARWVDISAHIRDRPETIQNGPYSIEAPASQPFSVAHFAAFVARFRRSRLTLTRIDATPNLLIREWRQEDLQPTQALLQPIAIDYPGFDVWLRRKLGDPQTSKKVVIQGAALAAFSMWQLKDPRNVKLQTFMVGSLFRGTAMGQHLLYHELRTWACDSRIERVYVTVSSGKIDLIDYFKQFGFRVEGFAPNRYDRPGDAAELIMTKHLIRRIVRTKDDLESVVEHVTKRIWGIRQGSADRFGVKAGDMGLHLTAQAVTVTPDSTLGTAGQRLAVTNGSGGMVASYDDAQLMADFFPLRIHLSQKRYVVVPIFRRWVEAMLSTSGPDTPLKLRVDNAYYCYPKVREFARGDLVVFYEPKKEGGRGAAIGAAVVLEVAIDTPVALHSRFSNLGIYQLSDVNAHANTAGNAMAIRFGLFEPFEKPVALTRIREFLGNATNIQGLTPISRDPYERIRTEGLGES